MRLIKMLTLAVLCALPYGFVAAQDWQTWCNENTAQCTSAINVCETNDELDCDDYMEKIMRGDYDSLPEIESRVQS